MFSTSNRFASFSPPNGEKARKMGLNFFPSNYTPPLPGPLPRIAAEREILARSGHALLSEVVICYKFQNFSLAQVLL
jgi:hypothetical protein